MERKNEYSIILHTPGMDTMDVVRRLDRFDRLSWGVEFFKLRKAREKGEMLEVTEAFFHTRVDSIKLLIDFCREVAKLFNQDKITLNSKDTRAALTVTK